MDHFNAIRGTVTVGGTGNLTVSATGAGKGRPLSTLLAGWTGGLRFDDPNGVDWELSLCTMLTATTLSRDTLLCSSTGSKVNFAIGTTVIQTVVAEQLNAMLSVSDIPFAASIPLTRPGNSYMANKTVSGALTFTPAASAVRGALVYLRCIADGTNLPVYSAFKEWGGSLGYDNRAGIENQMQFFFDGFNYWVSISQAVGAVAVPLPASAVSMTGPTGGIVSTASTAFTVGVTPTGGAITGTVVVTPSDGGGGTFSPTSVSLSSGTTSATFTYTPTSTGAKSISVSNNGGLTNPSAITYTVAAAATVPGTPAAPTATGGAASASIAFALPSTGTGTISSLAFTPYLAGAAQAAQTTTTLTSPFVATGLAAGNYTFTFHAVSNVGPGGESPASNTVAVAADYPRMTINRNITESGTGPYTYTGTGGAYGSSSGDAVGVKHFQPGVDGEFVIKLVNAPVGNGNQVLLAVDDSAAGQTYDQLSYGAVANSGANGIIGAAATSSSTVGGAINDYMRVRRTGTTLTLDVSKDNGATYTNNFTWAGVPTGVLYIHCQTGYSGTYLAVSQSGLA